MQGGSRSYREKLDDIDKQSSCISERVAGLAVLMEAHTKNKEDVAMKVDCLKNEFKRHSESLEGLEKLCACLSDRAEAHDVLLTEYRAARGEWQAKAGEIMCAFDKHKACAMKRAEEQDAKLTRHISSEKDRFRTKMAKLEGGYDAHSERLEALGNQYARLIEKVTMQGTSVEAWMLEERKQHTNIDRIHNNLEALEAKVDKEERKQQSKIDRFKCTLECGLENLVSRFDMSEKKHRSTMDTLQSCSKHLESRLDKAHKERLAELHVVCEKLDQHENQLRNMPTAADLSSNVQRLHLELQTAMQERMREAQLANQTMVSELGKLLEKSTAEQGETLRKHGVWMKDVDGWLEQAQERERGLGHILFRIVEEHHSELASLFEEVLIVPQKR